MLYSNLRKFIKKFPTFWKFLTWSKDHWLNLSRLKDILMMKILFCVWPEQTYRFSTRKFLPSKKNRFSKELKPVIPYDLLKSKSSNIPKMKEINVIGRGSSFDLNNLKEINGPIFLMPFWKPLVMDSNGKITYQHGTIWDSRKFDTDEYFFYDLQNQPKDFFKEKFNKKNVTYVIALARSRTIENFMKTGNNILCVNMYATDKDGNNYSLRKNLETLLNFNLINNDQCKLISMVEKVYRPPLLKPYTNFAPTGSFVPFLSALSFFAEKINVYGWDFYLDSSPENMSYWQLFFNMCNYMQNDYNLDRRSRNHFESALINYYYGYQFSKLPNFNFYGYLGQLDKHEKLIKRIERVLFN